MQKETKQKIFKISDRFRIKFIWSILPEVSLYFLAIAFFFWASKWIREIDPTAGALDPSYLHFAVLGAVVLMTAILFSFIFINFAFKFLDRWFDGDDEKDKSVTYENKRSLRRDFHDATPNARLGFFLTLFLSLVGFFVLSVIAFT